jgi:hypothetical protein
MSLRLLRIEFVCLALVFIPSAFTDETPEYWVDHETNKMWMAADNGSGLSLSQAKRYCQQSSAGGFKDWTLPSIDDLQSLFGGPENSRGQRIKGPIKLTGWQWSSTPGQQDGEGWTLDFGDGGRASVHAGDSGLNRALCVRSLKNRVPGGLTRRSPR